MQRKSSEQRIKIRAIGRNICQSATCRFSEISPIFHADTHFLIIPNFLQPQNVKNFSYFKLMMFLPELFMDICMFILNMNYHILP